MAQAALQPPGEDAYVGQARDEGPAPSKVYFPDAITPESVAQARVRAAQQDQLEARDAARENRPISQLSKGSDGRGPMGQLSDGSSARALAQLSEAERQVLLEAIEGTDICNDPPDVDAVRQLCRDRIEARSSDFAPRMVNALSAEERLLGEGLDTSSTPAIEKVIERLARNVGKADDFDNQAIASVALADNLPADPAADDAEQPGANLSPETQALINGLIERLTNTGGGS